MTTGGPIASADADVFVAKVAPDGQSLVYATYLGGTGSDQGEDIAIDARPWGHAYLTGSTNSTDFPAVNALNRRLAAWGPIAFVARLSADGT